jgi:ketosteroid isomerase-like protein
MSENSFDAFMQMRRRVAQAYVRGDAAPLRAISALSDPATFFGPSGGVEKGAKEVLAANELGAKRFGPDGETELEVLQQGSSGDVAYWVGLQRATVITGGYPKAMQMTLRVTEVFRREGSDWKLVHRHADAMANKTDGG